jgi:hypothetical protein
VTKKILPAEAEARLRLATANHEIAYWQEELRKAKDRDHMYYARIKVNQEILDLEHRIGVMEELLNKFDSTNLEIKNV